ncbi:tail fiber assembly protein [Serratia marcescens]|nr:tail fiber assembly protein [Serratia marcescens]
MSIQNTELHSAVLGDNGLAVISGWITVYSIEPEQREFQQASLEYLPEGVGLPALSFADKPTLAKSGFALVRNADGTRWEQIPDYRGRVAYSTTTGEPMMVTALGDLSSSMTLLEPSTPYDKWDGQRWVTDREAQHTAAMQEATLRKARLIEDATYTIAPLQDALDMEIATDEEVNKLKVWKTYRVLLNRVDISVAPDVNWPIKP